MKSSKDLKSRRLYASMAVILTEAQRHNHIHMTKRDMEHFKKKLTAEKGVLEEDLNGVGERSSSNPAVWDASAKGMQADSADENEVASKLEEYEDNAGIATQLENQLSEVVAALERIDKGTYGMCEVCGKPIETERLEANPAAKVSIKHAH